MSRVVVERIEDSVVAVRVPLARRGGRTSVRTGTGVILEDGSLVTAAHVLLGANETPERVWDRTILRRWDAPIGVGQQRVKAGAVMRAIPDWDVARIWGLSDIPGVRPARISNHSVRTGDAVAAFGLGGGQRRTTQTHVISRSADGRFFAIDLDSVKGDSGGPVFDANGDIVGIIIGGGPPYEPWNAAFQPGSEPPIHIRSIRLRRLPTSALCVDLRRAMDAMAEQP